MHTLGHEFSYTCDWSKCVTGTHPMLHFIITTKFSGRPRRRDAIRRKGPLEEKNLIDKATPEKYFFLIY